MNLRTKARFAKLWASTESAEVSESVSTTEVGGNENGAVVVEEIRVEKELALDLAAMEQDIAILDQDESTAEELATATEEIVRLGDAVESFASEGGLNRQGAQFLNMALESITTRVGVEFNVPAVESFSGSFGDRVAMTASLEAGIGESLKKAWDALVQFIKEQLDKLKAFVKRLFDSREKLKKVIKVKTDALKLAEAGGEKFTVNVLKDDDQAKVIGDSVKMVRATHDGLLGFIQHFDNFRDPVDNADYIQKLGDALIGPIKGFISADGENTYKSSTSTLFGSFSLELPAVGESSKGNWSFTQDAEKEDKEVTGADVTRLFEAAGNYCSEINIDAMMKSFSSATDKVLRATYKVEEDNNGVKGKFVKFLTAVLSRQVANPSFIKMDALNMKALNKMVASAKPVKAKA